MRCLMGLKHRERLVSQQAGVSLAKKMAARNQHIGRNHEFASAAHIDDGRVVADPEHRMARAMGKVAPDQLEFGRHCALRLTAGFVVPPLPGGLIGEPSFLE